MNYGFERLHNDVNKTLERTEIDDLLHRRRNLSRWRAEQGELLEDLRLSVERYSVTSETEGGSYNAKI